MVKYIYIIYIIETMAT